MFSSAFAFTPAQDRFRDEVRDLLHSDPIQHELSALRSESPLPHPERTYRALGDRGWLAADWPERYGGMGASIAEAAIVAEEMALAGVPDSARINTVDNAGATLLAAGTEEQKAAHLPAMASGRRLCSVLYSEPDAGSDLGRLQTRAERDGDEWRLTGEKCWNVGSGLAEFGICAARTGAGRSRYADISLFMVPLHQGRVHVAAIASLTPERFDRVTFNDCRLPPESLIGPPGAGWQLINDALVLERTGVYFYGRAQRWLRLLSAHDQGHLDGDEARRLRTRLPMARLLTWHAVDLLARGENAAMATAGAKWWTSELAVQVARLAWRTMSRPDAAHGPPSAPAELTAALREAPGLTIAGGTSEMMLAAVTSALLDEATYDPLRGEMQ